MHHYSFNELQTNRVHSLISKFSLELTNARNESARKLLCFRTNHKKYRMKDHGKLLRGKKVKRIDQVQFFFELLVDPFCFKLTAG